MPDTIITNQKEMDALFASVSADFERIEWQPVLERGLRMFEAEHGQMFAEQREPASGPPWKPLAASTVRRKGHSTILFETGRLRGSLRDPKHSHGIREMFDNWPGGTGLVFGTDVPYSQFHMAGTKRMPARPHVGTSERTIDLLTGHAADHALAGLKQ